MRLIFGNFLIFDSFPSMERAEAFLSAVKERFKVGGRTFKTEFWAQIHNPVPFGQEPPIVHIKRRNPNGVQLDAETEKQLEELVEEFGGEFRGT